MSDESTTVLRIIEPGFGCSIQDQGRIGWRRFGVPPSGCMDSHAALCANNLLENKHTAPVLEILLGGFKGEMLLPAWIAVTGAASEQSLPLWRAYHAMAGEQIHLRQHTAGVWMYLAVEGGFEAPDFFGSVSYYARGDLGSRIEKGSRLARRPGKLSLPKGVAGRIATWSDRRNYSAPPVLKIWRGPQWKSFSHVDRERFLTTEWTVRADSDRVGYRLNGPFLKPEPPEIISEPVRVGSIQVPEDGQPIVIMRDGPTVGGYPKIALVDEEDLSWLAQSRPGQKIKFHLVQS
jgi:biotin-dependent carboxylase-like uncharacterized protein